MSRAKRIGNETALNDAVASAKDRSSSLALFRVLVRIELEVSREIQGINDEKNNQKNDSKSDKNSAITKRLCPIQVRQRLYMQDDAILCKIDYMYTYRHAFHYNNIVLMSPNHPTPLSSLAFVLDSCSSCALALDLGSLRVCRSSSWYLWVVQSLF